MFLLLLIAVSINKDDGFHITLEDYLQGVLLLPGELVRPILLATTCNLKIFLDPIYGRIMIIFIPSIIIFSPGLLSTVLSMKIINAQFKLLHFYRNLMLHIKY